MNSILIFHDNSCSSSILIKKIVENTFSEIVIEDKTKVKIFSPAVLESFIKEEEIHEHNIFGNQLQSIKTLSGGEQKKALLQYLIHEQPEILLLDNPFDHLDAQSQQELHHTLKDISTKVQLVLLLSRKKDIPDFMTKKYLANNNKLSAYKEFSKSTFVNDSITIPKPIEAQHYNDTYLIQCKEISVSYGNKHILKNINWNIKPGEFWQLTGPNGSGKTTLLSMITGDNVKGYGQELYLFGHKKGSGESVWELKKNIGYFTTNLTQQFTGRYTAIEMIIGGFFDAVGLYNKPTEVQLKIASQWLSVMGLENFEKTYFKELSLGYQRMIMIARAMVKHPLLLILDEPTTGLDEDNVRILVNFINKIAAESTTAILYVSHRKEEGLTPKYHFTLSPSENGSTGKIH
ncbi:hypothetical protein NBRC110019_23230 [Neptunitalea chrysea]|uniref:ABC transporter domain-containing protein n=1 Tax=Neptunitalea chrysea TaxID=1647581 RepID=A0A9W6B605_9FLAO|nr:ATP-binding cassette domain-containing protein [Neptunitalea chrysea]GLB53283.1 hypothetical protein NBRC110019_23230 [Neptunitalea chrysea]